MRLHGLDCFGGPCCQCDLEESLDGSGGGFVPDAPHHARRLGSHARSDLQRLLAIALGTPLLRRSGEAYPVRSSQRGASALPFCSSILSIRRAAFRDTPATEPSRRPWRGWS